MSKLTFINLMKEKETRNKVLYTVLVLLIVNFLVQLPIFCIKSNYLEYLFSSTSVLTFMDSLSGGSMSKLSVAGFGITSYITATIIIQLAAVIFPKIEKIRKSGESGKKLMKKIEFAFAMVMTFISGLSMAIAYGRNGLFIKFTPFYVCVALLCWLVGSAIVILLAQSVEEKGIGNGISLILCFNILSRIPNNIQEYIATYAIGKGMLKALVYVGGLVVALYIFYVIAIYLQCGVLNVPLLQTKKSVSVMNDEGSVPVSVNISNVLPVIYASSILAMPQLIALFFGIQTKGKAAKLIDMLTTSNWYAPTKWYHLVGLAVYVICIIAFSFFASRLSFSSEELADSMKKNGDVIPGVKPGSETVAFFERRRKVMSLINVLFLLVIALLPDFICTRLGLIHFTFLGTSLIIIVSCLFDTALRLRAASIHNDRHYSLFLNKSEKGKRMTNPERQEA